MEAKHNHVARLRLLKGILPYLKEIYNRPCFQNFEAIKLEIWRDCDDMNCGLKCEGCKISFIYLKDSKRLSTSSCSTKGCRLFKDN